MDIDRITKKHIDKYKSEGVVVIKSIINTDLIDEIKKETQEIFKLAFVKNEIRFEENDKSFNQAIFKLFKISFDDFLGCAKASQHILTMNHFASSEKINQLLQKFGLIKPIICVKPIIFFNSKNLAKQKAHYKTPAHQDWRSMQGSLNSLVVWIPLVDIKKDLGPVEFIPKSHLNGLIDTYDGGLFQQIPTTDATDKSFVSYEVSKGDLVVFSSFTIHRSGNNISDDIRWSMHFRYNDLNEKTFIDRSLPHPYKVYHPDKELMFSDFPNKDELKNVFLNGK